MQTKTKRTNSKDNDFISLVKELDAFLTIQNGEKDDFFSQFNGLEDLQYVVVLYVDKKPIGCGALKIYNNTTVEIKRMYIQTELQGKNLGVTILKALETWATELGNTRCILETGTMLPEAIRFYEKNNYQRIPNYDQYIGVEESVCFEKQIGVGNFHN
ncbi:GNAT family N-acetyltransferase [Kordia jejudonensis]|uniref:GNAT family N-acetyltransferase n=1 Tax=Kordia jejudonensis TaxID=1348245 RepID=UPI000629388A|nr:GNAT family N-acetyltransferase [Kordia jejudonensis]